MGSECTPDEREFRYRTFHQAIHDIDKGITKELNNPNMKNKKYSPFALINQGICNKYKFLLKEEFDQNEARKTIFNYKDLIKKTVEKNYKINNQKLCFSFPSNFLFINKDIMEVIASYIDKKYYKHLSTIYNIIIGGGCLIMKEAKDFNDDFPYRYIILYNEIQDNMGNEIDFFINIKDKKERNVAVDYILQNNLWDYFDKIKFDYRDGYKTIYNDYYKVIGYVVSCCSVNKINFYKDFSKAKIESKKQYDLLNKNQNNQQINKTNNAQFNPQNINLNNARFNLQNNNKIDNYKTKIDISNYANNPELLVDAAISFLFSIDKLRIFFGKNKNIDFQSFKTIIMTNVGQNIKKMKTYEEIFSELLSNVDQNNLISKDYYNQTLQYDEVKGRKIFLEKHKNINNIQKMFLIPMEEKIFCNNCRMNYFFFDYNKYIILKDSQINSLNKIILGKETETCEKNLCNFCNRIITKLTIEKEFLSLPEWLIVIVEQTQINNLLINSFLYLNDKNNIIYSLDKFIEDKTNSLYFIDSKNNEFCNKFDNIGFHDSEKLSSKRPAVLFYYLNKNDINNNYENNIKNISNNNNIIINSNQIKIQQNINRRNIQQPKFNQNNITNRIHNNMNQRNNNQNLNQQDLISEQNGQNMNMNKGFNENFNSNNQNDKYNISLKKKYKRKNNIDEIYDKENQSAITIQNRKVRDKYLKLKKDKNFHIYNSLLKCLICLGANPKRDFFDKLHNIYKNKKLEETLENIEMKRKEILKDVLDNIKCNNKLILLKNIFNNRENKNKSILKKILNTWKNKAFNIKKYIFIFFNKIFQKIDKKNNDILRSALYTWLYRAMFIKIKNEEKIISLFCKDIARKKRAISNWRNLVDKLRNQIYIEDIYEIVDNLKKYQNINILFNIIEYNIKKGAKDVLKRSINLLIIKTILGDIFILYAKKNETILKKYLDIWKNKANKIKNRLNKLEHLMDLLDSKIVRDEANTIYQVFLIKKLFNDITKIYKYTALNKLKDFSGNKDKNQKLGENLLLAIKDIKPKIVSPLIKSTDKDYAYKILDNLFNTLNKGLKRNSENDKNIFMAKIVSNFSDKYKDYIYTNNSNFMLKQMLNNNIMSFLNGFNQINNMEQ